MRVECIRINKVEDFNKLCSVWKKAEKGCEMTVFQSLDWNKLLFLEWEKSRYNKLFSYVEVYMIKTSTYKMLIPVIVQVHSTNLKGGLGRKKGIYILGQGSYSDYLNIVYDNFSSSMFSMLIKNIREKYPRLRLHLFNIREDTALYDYLRENYESVGDTISVAVCIPNSIEEFNQSISKHTRQNLRTALNRMTKDSMQYEWIENSVINDERVLDELVRIHMKRMKTKNANDEDFIHKMMAHFRLKLVLCKEKNNNIVCESMKSMKNSFVVIVKLQGRVVGYIYGLKDKKGVIRIMQNCVDEDYKFYSPMFRGIYDYILSICGNKEIKEIDFTRGDEEYKYKLGGIETKLYDYSL